MGRIYTLGETVYDIIFRDNRLVAGMAGGAMLNTAVSLGRLGRPVSLISEWGCDAAGDAIDDFLSRNGVDTGWCCRYQNGKTVLALASLDAAGDARYSFYKAYPPERLNGIMPPFKKGDMLMFGSFYAIDPIVRPTLRAILEHAHQSGVMLFYDPNIRKNHLHQLAQCRPFIIENMALAHIIRGSHEDFINLFGTEHAEAVWQQLLPGRCLIVTKGGESISLLTPGFSVHIKPEPITPVSTIGAGDTFNAGIAFGLRERDITPDEIPQLSREEWRRMLVVAGQFAADACMGYENYISTGFANTLLQNGDS